MNLIPNVPKATNEVPLAFGPSAPSREAIAVELDSQLESCTEIFMIHGGKEVGSTERVDVVRPDSHGHRLAICHQAWDEHVEGCVNSALSASKSWSRMPFEERAAIFLRAAELAAGPWRSRLTAATMLGQGKTLLQADADAGCGVADFLRFNVEFARTIYEMQPESSKGTWNQIDHRPLEGFVYAVTPFNFTALASNLATAPALMGNTVIWKPAHTASASNFLLMKMFQEAGLPPGVINFMPGSPAGVSERLLASPHLSGIHFTGSTEVFHTLWQGVASNIRNYRSFPRLVGEAGGKNFVLAHRSADVEALAVALIRGAFEYQGQKCSAASRAYIPKGLWPALRRRLIELASELKVALVTELDADMSAVIDSKAYRRITDYISKAKAEQNASIVFGGESSAQSGYVVSPTIIEVFDPAFVTMREEVFGPLLSVFVYDETRWEETLQLVDSTSDFALTGSIFATDRSAISQGMSELRFSAGNLYINDKPSGSSVGQQPFGGGRSSGTNDKAGSALNLLRWVSPRTIKENFLPPRSNIYAQLRDVNPTFEASSSTLLRPYREPAGRVKAACFGRAEIAQESI